MNKECSCVKCVGACNNKPGWFMPGEAEQAAALFDMPLAEFFATKCSVDWYENYGDDDRTVFVISPAHVNSTPGAEMPFDPRGTCRLLVDGKCSIHAAKPMECAEYMHGDSRDATSERKQRLTHAWDTPDNQAQIVALLGHAPVQAEDDDSLDATNPLAAMFKQMSRVRVRS